MMRKLWRRLYFLLHRRRLERELAEEMEAHREMMPEDRRAHFGNTTRLQEDSRDVWSWAWLEQLTQDLAYGVRVLNRARGFTLGAVAVLALGVGVNLAEFQIFDAMIFHRLHIADADSVLQFFRASRQGQLLGFPSAAVEFYRSRSASFAWLVSEDTSIDAVIEGDVVCARTWSPPTISPASASFPPGGAFSTSAIRNPTQRPRPCWLPVLADPLGRRPKRDRARGPCEQPGCADCGCAAFQF